ncbi:hypothetical protein HDU81_010933 [Chytriomyces hyalinus]|nr:hypothetical protein HDU81_010933 [Chytriomyces hyalinus]
MGAIWSKWTDQGPEPVFVPEEDRNPDILYTKEGYEVTGKLTRNKTIIKAGLIVLMILLCSWTAQFVAFALPNWRGDRYHNGGLFQVCGTADLVYVPSNRSLVANPNTTRPYSCQPIGEYVDTFKTWVCLPGLQDNEFCTQADHALHQLYISRWFQALTTILDMGFGFTTIAFMFWPDREPKKSMRNGWIALIGIILAPWFCLIDLFLQNSYWDMIGVGYFDRDARNFLHGASQASIITSSLDLIVQFGFLQWAVNRHGWRFIPPPAGSASVDGDGQFLGPARGVRTKKNLT